MATTLRSLAASVANINATYLTVIRDEAARQDGMVDDYRRRYGPNAEV